ncbi:MAG TPA: flavin reductase family protein [Acidobacteriaceae bacterium]|nr:flavin reductase family protein [Acidobacteriaceae bacterium]
MHRTIDPGILYFGTPVVLVSSLNEDGSPNLAPMSSAWWLGRRCLLGFGARSKTPQNIIRTGECVLNLPSPAQAGMVDRLALTTGSNPLPEHKAKWGYRYEPDKFGTAGMTPVDSTMVQAPRAMECPVQLEATLRSVHRIGEEDEALRGRLLGLEVHIERIHVEEGLLATGKLNHIDPDKWSPLIMSFQQFYGLGRRLQESRLASIPESNYRMASVTPVAEPFTRLTFAESPD